MRSHLDLFSGIGGFALAAGWAGYETIGFCEIDPYCVRVLRHHFPDVPVWGDVRQLTYREVLDVVCDTTGGQRRKQSGEAGSGGIGLHRGAGTVAGVDLITAGYPCQPFSLAGKRLGAEDDRHLWPEVRRLLAELRPARFLGENVAGHINMGLDDVLSDLEALGYAARPVVIPACAVNAPHRRDRVWIMAHAERGWGREQLRVDTAQGALPATERGEGTPWFGSGGEDVADAESGVRFGTASRGARHAAFGGKALGHTDEPSFQSRLVGGERAGERAVGSAGGQRCEAISDTASEGLEGGAGSRIQGRVDGLAGDRIGRRPETQQRVGFADDGLPRRLVDPRWGGDPLNAFGPDWEDGVPRVVATEPDRVHRLKALGNSVVPQIPYLILKAMDGELDA